MRRTSKTLPAHPRPNASPGKSPAPEHPPSGPVNTTALQRIERAARRLRSAEVQVDDLRRALAQEIRRAVARQHSDA
jgi:hypothetical protein